jgi:hypothetical protein
MDTSLKSSGFRKNSIRLGVRSRLKPIADKVASALELSLSATLQEIQACKRYCDNSKHGHSSTNLDRTRKSREVTSTSAAHARVIAAAAEPSALVRTMIFPLHAALAQGGQHSGIVLESFRSQERAFLSRLEPWPAAPAPLA